MNIHTPGFDPANLDMVMRERDYVIYYADAPLLTLKGNEVCHPNDRFIRNLLTELELWGHIDPIAINLFSLFEFLCDKVAPGNDPFAANFKNLLEEDPYIHLKRGTTIPNEKSGQGAPGQENITPLVNLHFWSNTNLLLALNGFIGEQMYKIEEADDVPNPMEILIEDIYNQSSRESKAAIRMLSEVHGSWVTLPMLLVMGRITPGEYCKAVLSFQTRSALADGWFERYPVLLTETHAVRDFISGFSGNGEVEKGIPSLLKEGEGDFLEFKSTLRWDIRAGKTSQAVERACLKTISAFLNTNGGVLLIGVRDDGSIEGVETDRFPNEDKFLLHLWTLIRTCLGRDVSPHILTRLEKIDEKTVCMLRCSRNNRPVFLRQPGFNEEFYIRVGPGSAAMDISEALKYIADHFPA